MDNGDNKTVLEGLFAVSKPAMVSSADVLTKLQATFAPSQTFAALSKHQPKRPSKGEENVFKIGHGGTLDPLAASVLIVGIGRGTKQLQQYLACSKTYDTVVLFGASTDTYDCTGTITQRAPVEHVTKELVEVKLAQFRGTIMQAPPLYSALKINGIKACEYARQGKELPRELESREMQVDECTLLEWYPSGQTQFRFPGETEPALAPAARIRLTVCSGFYVRSFAHDLGLACESRSHMASLLRTRQANFTIEETKDTSDLVTALSYQELEAGEEVWGAKLQPQLTEWVRENPLASGHVDGRTRKARRLLEEKGSRPRQRFRGGYLADTKLERIKQQGGKWKGKWGKKPKEDISGSAADSVPPDSDNFD